MIAAGPAAVNAVLTMDGYAILRMAGVPGSKVARARRLAALLLALLSLAFAHAAAAQTALTADWTNLGKGNLVAVPNGSTLAVGPNSVTITTQKVTNNNGNDANFVPFYSTDMLAYYTGQIGSQDGTLMYTTDHTSFDAGDYFETIYTLGTSVQSLAFTVSNVDRYFGGGFNFHDAVTIEYDIGNGTWLNLRSLAVAYTLGSAVGTTTINGVQGFHGTNYAGSLTSTTGDIRVAFGAAVTVKRIRIRYHFGQQNPGADPTGSYQFIALSDLTWTQLGVATSDLSLTKTVSNATPASGSTITYTVSLTNGGPAAASGVVVRDILPAGFTFASAAASNGSYNSATGDWTIASIASGQTRTLTITGTITAPPGVAITNGAEVWSSPNYDPDSTPGNGIVGEDDLASATATIQGTRSAGTAPVLACPAGSALFDWDLNPWPAGSLTNSYALAGVGAINFSVSANGTWVNDAAFGGMSPTLSNQNNGGFAGTQLSLHQYLDFNTRDETATTVISLPTAVPGVQFTIFDIDYAVNDFADRLTVTGSYQGANVTPTLTNGVSNYVIGNKAIGDGASGGTSGDGNVVVTFAQPVDTITIVYGNANTAPANPDGQAIAVFDITMCRPVATLAVTKLSTLISDPVNGTANPKHIPGAVIEYCILMQNPGSGTATNLVGTDNIAPTLTYTANSMVSGTTCAGATTAEDDNATGADETDPFGASIAGTVLTATATTLAPNGGFALKFRATVR